MAHARPEGVGVKGACRVLQVHRGTMYRWLKRGKLADGARAAARSRKGCHQPRGLSATEVREVLGMLNSERFRDQPPREVYHTLLSEGIYLCSVRTMYRVLAREGQNQDRRAQREAQSHAVPRLKATRPNEVWCWDITKLATHRQSVYLSLYCVMDLFSRYVVAWMISRKENNALARQLMTEAAEHYGVTEETGLTVHQDRGSPMTAHRYLDLMHTELGMTCSHSRPRVSNDNPHIESSFRTLKYQPDYPGRFYGVEDGREWCEDYFKWHNFEHHHVGLSGFTPHEVYSGDYQIVLEKKQNALSDIYARQPERFVGGRPQAKLPPKVVMINPYTEDEKMVNLVNKVNFPTLTYLR